MTAAARVRRRLAWRFEEDGSLSGTFRLPPLAGAVLLKALRAATGDLEHPQEQKARVPAETPAADQAETLAVARWTTAATAGPAAPTSSSLADALLVIAEAFLAGKVAAADDPEVYQVIVHVGTDAITPGRPGRPRRGRFRGNAAPPPPRPQPAADPTGHPADPARCHVEDGPAISVTTAQMIACSSTLDLDAARQRREAAGPGPPPAPAERGAAPGGPGTGHVPVPVPGL